MSHQKRVFFSIVLGACVLAYWLALRPAENGWRSDMAALQLSSEVAVTSNASHLYDISDFASGAGTAGYLLFLVMAWREPIVSYLKSHKAILGLLMLLILAGCGYKADIVDINANQTAFLIPVTGDTAAQQQFQSVDFLKHNQVAVKQVTVPYSWRQTGQLLWIFPTGDWKVDDRLIVLDRALVTRDWTNSEKTGSTASNQAFGVESVESVGFTVGATCTAIIDEANAATYLYYFGEKSLSDVMDTNVRGFVQSELFNEFGKRTLEQGQADKGEIFAKVAADATANFKAQGISILTLGGSEGMVYDSDKVQQSIDDSYAAAQSVFQAQAQATKQSFTNAQMVSAANAAATATVIAGAAQAQVMQQSGEMLNKYPAITSYTIAQKSNGSVPQILVLGDGQGAGGLPFTVMIPPPQATPTGVK